MIIACGRNQKLLDLIKQIISTKSEDILLDCMYLFDDKLKMCNGCAQCFIDGNCHIDKSDNMNEYKNRMMQADIILLLTTSYLGNISGISKAFIERLSGWFQLFILLGKRGVLLVVNDNYSSQLPVLYLKNIFYHLGIDVILSKSFSIKTFEDYCQTDLWKEITNIYYKNEIISEYLNEIFVKVKGIILSMDRNNYKKIWWEQREMIDCKSIYDVLNKLEL